MNSLTFKKVATLNKLLVLGVCACALGLSGCSSTRTALGLDKVVPDEFRVVTKAPLVVPPDFSLRPPSPGEPRPEELQPDSSARQAMLGQRDSITRSQGEQLLVQKAGAAKADPLARYVVDDEFGDLAYKEETFADRVMFWKKPVTADTAATNTVVGQETATVDAAAEAERIQKLTGNQPVIIQQKREPKLKLPGL